MDLGLKGRTALITGASKGIGKNIAKGLAAEGVNVVLLARSPEPLQDAAEEIRKSTASSNVHVLAIPTDVKNMDAVQAAAKAAAHQFKTIHILVNNAGSAIRRYDRQITWKDQEWIDDIDGKMIGALRCTQALLPYMPKDG